ncbi:MAG: host-nuclease inhibitor Gam family protein [Sandaracinobacter sp.]
MSAKRRKADKLPAAQSTEEAIALLARFAEVDAILERSKNSLEEQIAALRAQRDRFDEAYKVQLKAIFNQLKPWWAVAGQDLTEGKRKSIELGGCQIGHRTSTPALKLEGITEAQVLEDLETLGFEGWAIRTKKELDKPALIAALRKLGATGPQGVPTADAIDAEVLAGLGLKVSQKEEFFIARIPPVEPAVETVAANDDGSVR